MAIDTPAKIAIIGAGPIGLETALYARFLGYDVEIFERARICENLLRIAETRLDGPFAEHRSTLGLAALSAQDSAWQPPADDALMTCCEWVERYLAPLAKSDLVVDSLREQMAVVGLGRDEATSVAPAGETESDEEVTAPQFLLTIRDANGAESRVPADAVVDCSGLSGEVSSSQNPGGNWLSGLRIEFDAATGAPHGMAELLRSRGPAEGSPAWQPLVTSEPDFYVLGAKSHGKVATFNFARGLAQIRDLFTLIHDRPDLDIYQRMAGVKLG